LVKETNEGVEKEDMD